MRRLRRWPGLLLVAASAAFGQELGLDLTPESSVKPVVLAPPIYRAATAGGFAGFDSSKEKVDPAALKKQVAALQKALGAKERVVSAENTMAAYGREKLSVALLRTPSGLARLAKATDAAWAVLLETSKQGVTTATIFSMLGEPAGLKPRSSSNPEQLAKELAQDFVELSKPKPEELAAAAPPPAPPAEEDVTGEVDQEMALDASRRRVGGTSFADPTRVRAVVLVGVGAQLRNQTVSGDSSLAELRSNATVSLALYAQLYPLQLVPALERGRLADLNVDLNYRRAFVRATGTSGDVSGQSCSVTDDDLQVRGTYRYQLGASGSRLPSVGLSGGWAQERSEFSSCSLPVVSALYRGIDVQLRVKQPLYFDWLSFDLAVGPRFLLAGPTAQRPGFSVAGEAWVEAKPYSMLFLRGGARLFRAQLADAAGLSTADLRVFVAFEAGAFL